MCTCPLEEFTLRPGVFKKDSVPDMIKVELTYVPIKGGIVYCNVDSFMVLTRPQSSFPVMLKLSDVALCPVCRLCTWMGEGSFRCSPVPFLQGPGCFPYVFFIVWACTHT